MTAIYYLSKNSSLQPSPLHTHPDHPLTVTPDITLLRGRGCNRTYWNNDVSMCFIIMVSSHRKVVFVMDKNAAALRSFLRDRADCHQNQVDDNTQHCFFLLLLFLVTFLSQPNFQISFNGKCRSQQNQNCSI